MRKLNGIHVKHSKNTASCETVKLAVPKEVIIPMNMNMGAHSIPTVKPGDHVDIGDLIGDTDAFMSAPVHSSVSGTVKAITEIKAMMGVCQAVQIETDEEQKISENVKVPVINNRDEVQKMQVIAGSLPWSGSGVIAVGDYDFPKEKCEDNVAVIQANGEQRMATIEPSSAKSGAYML